MTYVMDGDTTLECVFFSGDAQLSAILCGCSQSWEKVS